MKVEVTVPRRVPSDLADIVVYKDDRCREPYLVVENKAESPSPRERAQGIEQLFGNANSLRAELGLYDDGGSSSLYDVQNHPATERVLNRRGDRSVTPAQYGQTPTYSYIAGQAGRDIAPVARNVLETKIRRAHSIIWAEVSATHSRRLMSGVSCCSPK